MNKSYFFNILGGVSLLSALALSFFKEPALNFSVTSTSMSIDGSFSFLFILIGIILFGYGISLRKNHKIHGK
ncbi:MAG: hypothetical protein ABF682_08275 [Liquorilactobacillus sp.]